MGEIFEGALHNGYLNSQHTYKKLLNFISYQKHANSNVIFLHSHQNGKH